MFALKNVQTSELTRDIVSNFLASQIFLTTRYDYGMDALPNQLTKRKVVEVTEGPELPLGIPGLRTFSHTLEFEQNLF